MDLRYARIPSLPKRCSNRLLLVFIVHKETSSLQKISKVAGSPFPCYQISSIACFKEQLGLFCHVLLIVVSKVENPIEWVIVIESGILRADNAPLHVNAFFEAAAVVVQFKLEESLDVRWLSTFDKATKASEWEALGTDIVLSFSLSS